MGTRNDWSYVSDTSHLLLEFERFVRFCNEIVQAFYNIKKGVLVPLLTSELGYLFRSNSTPNDKVQLCADLRKFYVPVLR